MPDEEPFLNSEKKCPMLKYNKKGLGGVGYVISWKGQVKKDYGSNP